MSNWSDIIKLFLDKNVAQNGRFLLSLISAIALFLLFRNNSVFLEIKNDYGKAGIGICIFLFLLIPFIIINLIANKLSSRRKERRYKQEMLKQQNQKNDNRYNVLESLTASQKQLLARFVSQNKRQFQDYEIGGYKAVWGSDIEVLRTKRIIQQLTYGVYEIQEEHFNCIMELIANSESEGENK